VIAQATPAKELLQTAAMDGLLNPVVVIPAALAFAALGAALMWLAWWSLRRRQPLTLCPGRTIPLVTKIIWPPAWFQRDACR
jgi:hypothetical protein